MCAFPVFRVVAFIAAGLSIAGCSGGGLAPNTTPADGAGSNGAGNTAGGSGPSAAGLYTITYLPLQSGCQSANVGGLASNGIAVVDQDCSGQNVTYLYDHGKITSIPSEAFAVNAHEVVDLGTSLYNASTGKEFAQFAEQGFAAAINDSTIAVGLYNTCVGNSIPCLTAGEFDSTGALTQLNLPGGQALDINAKGDVSSQGGGALSPVQGSAAYLTTASNVSTDIGEALGYPLDQSSAAWGLNAFDHVVVTRGATTVLWKGGKSATNVPLLSGDAETKNDFVTDADVVIGDSCDSTARRACRSSLKTEERIR